MKRILLALALLCGIGQTAFAYSPTRIADTWLDGSGNPISGTLTISWPSFTAADATQVSGGRATYNVMNGVVNVYLQPNAGATATQIGASSPPLYLVSLYNPLNGTSTYETWLVPVSADAQTLADVTCSGSGCGTPSTAQTINSGTTDQFAYYAAAGTVLSGHTLGLADFSAFLSGTSPTSIAGAVGPFTSGDCAKWSSAGNIIDAGAPCGTGGGSTYATNSASITPGTIKDAALVSLGTTVTVTGAASNSPVSVSASPSLPSCMYALGNVSSTNTVTISLANLCGVPETIGATTFAVTVGGGGGSAGGSIATPGTTTVGNLPQYSNTTGTALSAGLGVVATVGSPGLDTNVPTEKSVRSALTVASAISSGQIVISQAPYYASGSSFQTTTTALASAAATSITVTSVGDFQINEGILIGVSGQNAGTGTAVVTITSVNAVSGVIGFTPALVSGSSYASGTNVQHDDSAAVAAAIVALQTTGGTILFPQGFYRANACEASGANNSVWTFPNTPLNTAYTTPIVAIKFLSNGYATFPANLSGLQTTIQTDCVAGSLLNAPSSITQSGFIAFNFSSQGILYRSYDNPSVTMLDLSHFAQMGDFNGAIDTGTFHPAQPTSSNGIAILTPGPMNFNVAKITDANIAGYYMGLVAGSHLEVVNAKLVWNWFPIEVNTALDHGVHINHVDMERYKYGIQAYDTTHAQELNIDYIETETSSTDGAWTGSSMTALYDPGSRIVGHVNYETTFGAWTKVGGLSLIANNVGDYTSIGVNQHFEAQFVTNDNVTASLVDSSVASTTNPAGLNYAPSTCLSWAASTNWYGAKDTRLCRSAAGTLTVSGATAGDGLGAVAVEKYLTTSNCSSTAAPAVCGTASAGTDQVAAAATTLTVDTTAVAALSQIFYSYTTAASGCSTAPTNIGSLLPPYTSGIVPGTSFTMTLPVAPATNAACVSWELKN